MKNNGIKTSKGMKIDDIEELITCKPYEKYDAIYVRESSKWQAENGYNIFKQEEVCIDYRKIYPCSDCKGLKIYREKGASAKKIKRPAMNVLIEDIKNGKIGRIIVQKLDRLSRRNSSIYPLLDMFMDFGVTLIAIREQINTASATWKMSVGINTLVSEVEQDTISERACEALTYAAEQGSYIKGGRLPLGLNKKYIKFIDGTKAHLWKLYVNEKWEFVKMIYEMAYDGFNNAVISFTVSNCDLAKELDFTITDDGVEKILSKPIYMGIMLFKGKEYDVSFDGCFCREYWNQVQINRRIHLKRETKNIYYYHEKVFCSCGTRCIVDVTKKRNANGIKRYQYYYCPVCKKRINQEKIKENIEPRIERKYQIDLKEKCKEKLEDKRYRIMALKNDLYQLYLDGKVESDIYFEQIQFLKDQLELADKKMKYDQKEFTQLKAKERKEYFDLSIDKIIVDMLHKNIDLKYKG